MIPNCFPRDAKLRLSYKSFEMKTPYKCQSMLSSKPSTMVAFPFRVVETEVVRSVAELEEEALVDFLLDWLFGGWL